MGAFGAPKLGFFGLGRAGRAKILTFVARAKTKNAHVCSPSEGETLLEDSQEKGDQKENPLQPEPSDPEIVGGARRRVSPQASQANSGQGSRPLPPHIKWWLSVCSPRLRGRYQPEQEAIESEEPSAPSLVQEQQASFDSREEQIPWHQGQALFPLLFTTMGTLITPKVAQGLESGLPSANSDRMAEHQLSMDGTMGDAQPGVLPVSGDRDIPNLETHPGTPAQRLFNLSQNPLFPESVLEKVDLSSLVENLPADVRVRILLEVEESHQRNLQRVHALSLRPEPPAPQQPAWTATTGRYAAGPRVRWARPLTSGSRPPPGGESFTGSLPRAWLGNSSNQRRFLRPRWP